MERTAVWSVNPSESFSRLDRAQFGMWLFLGTEILFFTAFLTTCLVIRFGIPVWPPAGTPRLPLFLPALNTLVLLLSSAALYHGQLSFQTRRPKAEWVMSLVGALILGLLFLSLQILQGVELYQKGFTLHTNIFANIFYMLIGVHWVHVAGGLILLTVLIISTLRRPQADPLPAILMRSTQMYWHFVDAVWLGLFILLYLA